MASLGRLHVVKRNEIAELLGAREQVFNEYVGDSCGNEVGKLMTAEWTAFGRISRIQDKTILLLCVPILFFLGRMHVFTLGNRVDKDL